MARKHPRRKIQRRDADELLRRAAEPAEPHRPRPECMITVYEEDEALR